MASEGKDMECYFEIDTKAGWEKSMTSVLSCFKDPTFFVNPSMGFAYVKGKADDPHKILVRLKKGKKHTVLQQVTNVSHGDNQYQASLPYASLPRIGDPHYYANGLHNYPYGNYNTWHNNNNLNHLLLNDAQNQYHGHNNHLHRPTPYHGGEQRSSIHVHQHDSSSVESSSSSSSTSRPVTEPLPSAPSTRPGFIKKVSAIEKITGKFRSCLGCCEKIKGI